MHAMSLTFHYFPCLFPQGTSQQNLNQAIKYHPGVPAVLGTTQRTLYNLSWPESMESAGAELRQGRTPCPDSEGHMAGD